MGQRPMSRHSPHRQASWDWRAAGNFIGGGAGSGLLVLAFAAGLPPGPAALAGGALIGLGLACVWLEIGKPWRAINVFFHPQTSWMTREGILAMALYAVGGGAVLLNSSGLLGLMALVAAGFVWCQGRILTSARGHPGLAGAADPAAGPGHRRRRGGRAGPAAGRAGRGRDLLAGPGFGGAAGAALSGLARLRRPAEGPRRGHGGRPPAGPAAGAGRTSATGSAGGVRAGRAGGPAGRRRGLGPEIRPGHPHGPDPGLRPAGNAGAGTRDRRSRRAARLGDGAMSETKSSAGALSAPERSGGAKGTGTPARRLRDKQ
ncbi:phenylacetyl CoA [Paramagnetospirillum caucaseum]|uniref:Phenylacetyl CoA n=1 Tax=Paramagnetospirillum caucaseum TaxID=1244869 RepID=M2ZMK4_9PROT|nr:phenylacetyl CoA [Paramagnetospirillum caucaseum]